MLHLLNILMKMHHLIVELFDSHFFIKIENVGSGKAELLLGNLPLVGLEIVKVYVSLFNEVLPKFTHTLSIFRLRAISNNASASPWFHYLWLRVNFRGVKIAILVSGKDAILGVTLITLRCLDVLPCIYLDMNSLSFPLRSES